MKKILLFFAIVSVAGMLASCNGNGKTAEAGSEGTATEENAEDVGFLQGFAYVDLGLSVNWATCNVGANAPEEVGDYFAWGETSKKDNYIAESNKYFEKQGEFAPEYTKYNSDDNLTKLEADDDAATSNWGTSWRTPTKDEFKELIEKCTWTWKGNGYEVKGANGKCIFFPVTGTYSGDKLFNEKIDGFYWASTMYSSSKAEYMAFSELIEPHNSNGGRCDGQCVRPICAK